MRIDFKKTADGYSNEGYSKKAIDSNNNNQNFQSRYSFSCKDNTSWTFAAPKEGIIALNGQSNMVVNMFGDAIIATYNDRFVGSEDLGGKLYNIREDGKSEVLFSYHKGLCHPIILNDESYILTAVPLKPNDTYEIVKLSATGKKVWSFETYNPIYGTPSIDSFGNCVFFTDKGGDIKIISLNSSGELFWEQSIDAGSISSNPVISKENRIFAKTGRYGLYILDSSGNIVSIYKDCRYDNGSPLRLMNNSFFCGDVKTATILNMNYQPIWTYHTDGVLINNSPSVSQNGDFVVFSLATSEIEVVSNREAMIFRTKTYYPSSFQPIVTSNNNIIVYGFENKYPYDESFIQVFDSRGEEKYLYTFRGTISSISLIPDGKMYVLSSIRKNIKNPNANIPINSWELRLLG